MCKEYQAEIARQDYLIERMWDVIGRAEALLNPGCEHVGGSDPGCVVCVWLDMVGDLTIISD